MIHYEMILCFSDSNLNLYKISYTHTFTIAMNLHHKHYCRYEEMYYSLLLFFNFTELYNYTIKIIN